MLLYLYTGVGDLSSPESAFGLFATVSTGSGMKRFPVGGRASAAGRTSADMLFFTLVAGVVEVEHVEHW